jgi:hypothetical protein
MPYPYDSGGVKRPRPTELGLGLGEGRATIGVL